MSNATEALEAAATAARRAANCQDVSVYREALHALGRAYLDANPTKQPDITPTMLQAGLDAWKASATRECNVSGLVSSYVTKRMDTASRLKAVYRAMRRAT